MEPLLTYLAPPVVGAFIGYSTNYVAIRMLFRPLTPWKFMGLRVPMTPGVIPSKRHQLAENIGEMVGRHLLTSEDVQRALSQADFQNDLWLLIDKRVNEILERDLGPVSSIVPKHFRSYFRVGVKILRWRFLKHLHAHLDSDQLAEQLGESIKIHLAEFLNTEVGACFDKTSQEKFYAVVESGLSSFIASPGVQEWVRNLLSEKIDGFIQEGGSLGDLVPESMREPLLARLEAETPSLLKKLAAMVEEPIMQDRIARAIGQAVQNFAGSLGPMAALLGNFLSPELIDQKIRGYLADKGKDIGQWLIDDTVQEKLGSTLRAKAEDLLASPLSQLLADVDPAQMDQARDWLADLVVGHLKNEETARSLTTLVRQVLTSQESKPLGQLITDLFGQEGLEKATSWGGAEVVKIVRSVKTKRMLDGLVIDLVENKLMAQPIGKLSDFLPKEVQSGISTYLLDQVSKLLIREVPELVDSLNIQQVVARKVDSLDLLRLEGLLLSIMQEQFKYINLFGGILGFLIGLFNLFFLLGN